MRLGCSAPETSTFGIVMIAGSPMFLGGASAGRGRLQTLSPTPFQRTMSHPEGHTMPPKFSSFEEFYPFYLGEHSNRTCRRLHFVGSALVLGVVVAVIMGRLGPLWLLSIPVIGYGFAWVGHFVFEKNRPATFTYPLWSLIGDWVMFGEMLTGKIRF